MALSARRLICEAARKSIYRIYWLTGLLRRTNQRRAIQNSACGTTCAVIYERISGKRRAVVKCLLPGMAIWLFCLCVHIHAWHFTAPISGMHSLLLSKPCRLPWTDCTAIYASIFTERIKRGSERIAGRKRGIGMLSGVDTTCCCAIMPVRQCHI